MPTLARPGSRSCCCPPGRAQEAAVEGLAAGADDYLVKPFAAQELLARVRASIGLTRMRARQARWRSALTESLHDGFFLASADGTVLEVNSAFRDIVGLGPDADLGQLPRLWWPDEAAEPEAHRLVATAYASTQHQEAGSFSVPLRHSQGHQIWAAVTFRAVDDPDTGARMLVGTIRDVTAERAAAQQETAVAAMTSHLSAAVTGDGVLAAGLAELRGQFAAPRVLAAVWDDDGTPALISEPPGTEWDELPMPLRAALESVRSQPILQISAPACRTGRGGHGRRVLGERGGAMDRAGRRRAIRPGGPDPAGPALWPPGPGAEPGAPARPAA